MLSGEKMSSVLVSPSPLLNGSVKKENYAVDVFKFICAFLVVIIHVNPCQEMPFGIRYFIVNVMTRVAVPFFFMCTGYFTFRKIDKNNIDYSVLKKSAVKMLKLYILWTVVYLPLKIYDVVNLSEGTPKERILNWLKEFFVYSSTTHLWYLRGLFVSIVLIAVLLKLKLSLSKILGCSVFFFVLGMFEDSYVKLFELFGNKPQGLLNFVNGIDEFFVTTRNGFCFAFLFVVLGVVFAWYPVKINMKKSWILFALFYLAMVAEAFFENHFELIEHNDKFLLLPVVMFFLFNIVLNTEIRKFSFNKFLRTLASLIYFIHYGVNRWLKVIFQDVFKIEIKSYVLFLLVLVVTIPCSVALMRIADKKQFKFLKSFV